MNDECKRFREAVTLMRWAQQDYFRTHSKMDLIRAKELERRVDEWIKDDQQENLFGKKPLSPTPYSQP